MSSLQTFIKKYGFTIVIGLVVILGIVFIVAIKIQKMYDNNPGLIPPQKNYDIQVTLTPEDEMEYETNIMEIDKKIQGQIATGDQEVELGSGIKGKMIAKPDMSLFMDKATAYTQLGKYNNAIKTMNEAFKKRYEKDAQGWEYLGNLYYQLDNMEMALKMYQKIIEVYPEFALEMLPRIIMVYTKLGDKEAAGQTYIHYELSGGMRDESLMQIIRELD